MLICRDCDQKMHDVSLPHHRRPIRSFMGFPSARDFAALWGFELNEIENSANQDQFASSSSVSADLNVVQVSGKPDIRTRGGLSSQHDKVCKMKISLPLYYSDEIYNFSFQSFKN